MLRHTMPASQSDSGVTNDPPRPVHPTDAAEPTFVDAAREGLLAARRNLLPGVVLWIAGVALLLGYFYVPLLAGLLDRLANKKEDWGLLYPMVSTAVFAGAIPWIVMRCRSVSREKATWGRLVFFLVFWAERGVEVDVLYRWQAHLFGHGNDVLTLVLKTVLDQFVYVGLWIVPTSVLAYLWFDAGCSLRRTREALRGHWYRRLMLPVMLANWGVWIPAVVIIYILPLPLQVPIHNLVVCLWALMLIFLIRDKDSEQA